MSALRLLNRQSGGFENMRTFGLLVLAFSLSACAPTFNRSGPGIIVTQTKDAQFVDNSVRSVKKGEACSQRILSVVAFGDASVEAAKSAASISKVATMDTEYFNILGVYGRACTVVTGQ
jgi:hypothetical protein